MVLDLTYHDNRAGERIRVDDSQRGTLTYSYDGLGRVTAETIAGVTTRWTYDRVGNRLTEAVGSAPPHTVRSYNGANQVVGWTYDSAGNLVAEGSWTDPNVNRYTYDIYNRLQSVDTPTTDRAYRYLDTMLLAEAGSIGGTADTTYVQDWGSGLSRIIQQTSNGTTSGFIYSPAGDRLLTTSSSAGDTYDLTDALGTVRATRSIAGSSLNDSTFTAWGTSTGTTTPAPFGFTGELQEPDTGLVYLRARWYNPATGTLLGRDPFDGRMTQSASLHLYQYGWNAPTMHTDPSGRDPWWRDHEDIVFEECQQLRDRSLYHEYNACVQAQEEYRQQRRAWNYYGQPSNPYPGLEYLDTIKVAAKKAGVPWQVVGAVLSAEMLFDTDWTDHATDMFAFFCPPGSQFATQSWKNFTPDPGPGIGNIHESTQVQVEHYFLSAYSIELPLVHKRQYDGIFDGIWDRILVPPDYTMAVNRGVAIEYVAWIVRYLADHRFGTFNGVTITPAQHRHDDLSMWTVADVAAMWHGYRYGVIDLSPGGAGFLQEDFTNRAVSVEQLISIAQGNSGQQNIQQALPLIQWWLGLK